MAQPTKKHYQQIVLCILALALVARATPDYQARIAKHTSDLPQAAREAISSIMDLHYNIKRVREDGRGLRLALAEWKQLAPSCFSRVLSASKAADDLTRVDAYILMGHSGYHPAIGEVSRAYPHERSYLVRRAMDFCLAENGFQCKKYALRLSQEYLALRNPAYRSDAFPKESDRQRARMVTLVLLCTLSSKDADEAVNSIESQLDGSYGQTADSLIQFRMANR